MFKFVVEGFQRFFTRKQQLEDGFANTDAAGAGILERFSRSNFRELDDEIIPLIDNLVANTLDHTTCYASFIAYLESWMGITVFPLETDEATRRKILGFIKRFYDVKGTKRGLISLFNCLDIDVVVNEVFLGYSFDSPITFDDTDRRFDQTRCSGCSDYSLVLTTRNPITITPEYLRGCYSIIKFNHPIGANLTSATLDGTEVSNLMLTEYVNQGGTATDVTNNDGYYVFLISGNIISVPESEANLVVQNNTLSLKL